MAKSLPLRVFHSLLLLSLLLLVLTGCSSSDGASSNGVSTLPNGRPVELIGANWMYALRDTIGNRRLSDIVIPGTHDSGTYGITADSPIAHDGKGIALVNSWVAQKFGFWHGHILDLFGIFDWVMKQAGVITSWWSKTQRNNFATQLQDGIRYFDLRVEQWTDATFYCVHSLRGTDLAELKSVIWDFYADRSQQGTGYEVLILDFQHTFSMDHDFFVALLKEGLRDKFGNSLMIPRGSDLNLQSIWATNKRILVFYDDDATVEKHPELWHSSSSKTAPQIHSPWANTSDPNVLFRFLGGQVNEATDLIRKSGTFTVLQSLATGGFYEYAISIEQYVYDKFRHTPIIGPILKLLGYDHGGTTTLLDWNFGGTTLATWLNNAGLRDLAAHRANIIIIDDYSSFGYRKSNGTQGGYLDLICELNTSRAAPSPQGPYLGVLKSQTANFTANHYQTYPVEFHFVNTGQVEWDPSVVFLGTAGPYDRTTHLYTNDGNWVSQTRIRMQNTTAVKPGQEAVFKFSITPDANYASSFQSFELVADKLGYPAQWFGEYYGNAAIYIQTDALRYASQLKSYSRNTTIAQFDTATLTATFTNTGDMPWFPDVVFLGVGPKPSAVTSSFYTPDGNWESNTRIRMQNTSAVMPGQDAIFTFDVTANALYASGLSFQLVADKAVGLMSLPLPHWFGSQGNVDFVITLESILEPDNLIGVWMNPSPDYTIRRGESQQVTFVFKNMGKISWYPHMMYLKAMPPPDLASRLYTADGSWFSVEEIPMLNKTPVRPGEKATFQFTVTPNREAVTDIAAFGIAISYNGSTFPASVGHSYIRVTVTD